MILSFEDFELDTDQLELRQGGEIIKIEPQVFSLLELLVTNAHRAVTKDEINEQVWGGRVVSEAALSSRIRSARKAVGDDGTQQRLIKTLRDRGFRFVGDVAAAGTQPSWMTAVAPSPEPDDTVSREVKPASIAVLPLRMLSDDNRYESLADAISHEVITDLSRLRWLHVIARGSSFRFRGPDVDVREVGRILGVRYILSGSLALFGSSSVINLELAESDTGAVVWADSIENSLEDLLEVWRDISLRVAGNIEGRIETTEADRATTLPTESLDAWASYFRGLWHMYRFNPHDNDLATRLFERALAADDRFARAHAGLSFTHFQNGFIGYKKNAREESRLASHHAERAFECDSLDPLVVLTMGRAEMLRGNWEAALPWFDRSTEMNPNYSWAFYHRALSSAVAGDGSTGPDHAMKAISLSPIDPLHYAMLASRALGHMARGEFEASVPWADRAAGSPGAHVIVRAIAGIAHSLSGDAEGAANHADDVRERDASFTTRRFLSAFPFRQPKLRLEIEGALDGLGF